MLELAGIVIGAAIALSACVLSWLSHLWQILRLVYLPANARKPRTRLWLRPVRLGAVRRTAIIMLRRVDLLTRAPCGNATSRSSIAPRTCALLTRAGIPRQVAPSQFGRPLPASPSFALFFPSTKRLERSCVLLDRLDSCGDRPGVCAFTCPRTREICSSGMRGNLLFTH
jgi:hypothetical protein